MSQTLYRKYRPKIFEELTGQDHIKTTLLNQIKSGKIAHAYLFTGPRGVGKTTTARLFAAAVNDEFGGAIFEGKDLDVIEIDAASYTGVDNVRENIIEQARVTPLKRKFKIFIIDEVHMLSSAAFNALLKILEEPPKHVIFVLATTELHKVPATIISRCQRFDFKKVPAKEIVERLANISKSEGVKVDVEVLNMIAKNSEGCLRDAETLLMQVFAVGGSDITMASVISVLPESYSNESVDLLKSFFAQDLNTALPVIRKIIHSGADIYKFFGDLIEITRLSLLISVTKKPEAVTHLIGEELFNELVKISLNQDSNTILNIIDILAKRRLEVKQSVTSDLPLELAVIEICLPKKNSKNITTETITVVNQNISQPKTEEPVTIVAPVKVSEVISEVIVEEIIETPQVAGGVTSLPVVRSNWSKMLKIVQATNPSVVLILKTAEPLEVSGSVIKIGYKYPFHKQRMKQPHFTEMIESAFNKVLNGTFKVAHEELPSDYISSFITAMSIGDEVEFVADVSPSPNTTSISSNANTLKTTNTQLTSEDLIKNLVTAFGGKIIE